MQPSHLIVQPGSANRFPGRRLAKLPLSKQYRGYVAIAPVHVKCIGSSMVDYDDDGSFDGSHNLASQHSNGWTPIQLEGFSPGEPFRMPSLASSFNNDDVAAHLEDNQKALVVYLQARVPPRIGGAGLGVRAVELRRPVRVAGGQRKDHVRRDGC
jgi:hypothetical protein